MYDDSDEIHICAKYEIIYLWCDDILIKINEAHDILYLLDMYEYIIKQYQIILGHGVKVLFEH
jgi:hypothetical protein